MPQTKQRAGSAILLTGLFAACAGGAAAQTNGWHVSNAPLRYGVDLTEHPTIASAGYIVTLPDGGALPGPHPVTTVIDANGNEVPSYMLYHTRTYGMAVLFATPPTAESVLVYVRGDSRTRPFTPDSNLTPSMLLHVRTGQASLAAAKQLGVGRAQDNVRLVRYRPQANGLQISCETTLLGMQWQGPPYAARLTGYLLTADPGRTWISAASVFEAKQATPQDGMEVYLDGTRIGADTKLSDKSCGRGQWMDLAEGLHKIEIYHAADPPKDRFAALLVTWRTPKTTPTELGGLRAGDLPYPNTPMWEARPIRADEFVHSGAGVIRSVEERDGAPVAFFETRPREVFHTSQESRPLLLYEFRALTTGNPKDTVYSWLPDGNARLDGKERLAWIFPAYRESAMTLTVASGNKKSTTTIPFFAYEPSLSTDLNHPSVRQTFREVCLDMLQAYPANRDPTANWPDTMWELFLANLEMGTSRPLLAHIFSRNWNSIKNKLDVPDRWRLEDIFYEWFSFKDPEQCIRWIERIEKNERHVERRRELRLMRAEIHAYFLKDFDAARQLVSSVTAGLSDVSAIAKVRLGDIEFLQGNLNEATRLYGEVQTQSRTDDHVGAEATGLQWIAPPKWKTDAGRAAVSKPAAGRQERVADWKKAAVLNTSASETLKALLSQGFYEEARNVLTRWERLLPLSKLSSDFVLHQADLYMKLGNDRKARALLEAYCANVDVSSYLAPAADLLLECMERTRARSEEVEAFAARLKKQLEFHPVAAKMGALLNRLKDRESKKRESPDQP